jgi:hypothetical protein
VVVVVVLIVRNAVIGIMMVIWTMISIVVHIFGSVGSILTVQHVVTIMIVIFFVIGFLLIVLVIFVIVIIFIFASVVRTNELVNGTAISMMHGGSPLSFFSRYLMKEIKISLFE